MCSTYVSADVEAMIGIMYGEHNMVEKRPIENMVEMVGIWFESEPTHVDWAAFFFSLHSGDRSGKWRSTQKIRLAISWRKELRTVFDLAGTGNGSGRIFDEAPSLSRNVSSERFDSLRGVRAAER